MRRFFSVFLSCLLLLTSAFTANNRIYAEEDFNVKVSLDKNENVIIRSNDEYWIDAFNTTSKYENGEWFYGSVIYLVNEETGRSINFDTVNYPDDDYCYVNYEVRTDSEGKYLYISKDILIDRFTVCDEAGEAGIKYYFRFEPYGYDAYTTDVDSEDGYVVFSENLLKQPPALKVEETESGSLIISGDDSDTADYFDILLYHNTMEVYLMIDDEYHGMGGALYLNADNDLELPKSAFISYITENKTIELHLPVYGYLSSTLTYDYVKPEAPAEGEMPEDGWAYAIFVEDENALVFIRSYETYGNNTKQSVIDIENNEYYGTVYSDIEDDNFNVYDSWGFETEIIQQIKYSYVGGNYEIRPRNMGAWFAGFNNLLSFDGSHFNTDNTYDMGGLFSGCTNLETIDISSFNTQNVSYMANMFSTFSSNLRTVVLGPQFTNWTNRSYLLTGTWTNGDLSILLNDFDLYHQYPSHAQEWTGTWVLSEPYTYESIYSPTYTFFLIPNMNRINYNHTAHQNDAEKTNTTLALQNENFRRALNCAFDKDTYNASVNNGTRNMYLIPQRRQNSQGVIYGDLVADHLNSYGVYSQTIDLSDGQDAYYSPAMCQEFIAAAQNEGISFPVYLDLPVNTESDTLMERSQSFKNSIETASNNQIIINLIEMTSDEYYNAGYYGETVDQIDYDISIATGWGFDQASLIDDLYNCMDYYLNKMGINGYNDPLMESLGVDTFFTMLDEAKEITEYDAALSKVAEAEAYFLSKCYLMPVSTHTINHQEEQTAEVSIYQDPVSENLLITSKEQQWLNEMGEITSDRITVFNHTLQFGTNCDEDYIRFSRDSEGNVSEIIVLYKGLLANNVPSSQESVEISFPATDSYSSITVEIDGLNACKKTPVGLKVMETPEGIRFYFDDPGQEELDYLTAMTHPHVWDYSVFPDGKYVQGSFIDINHNNDGSASDLFASNDGMINEDGGEDYRYDEIRLSSDGMYTYIPLEIVMESGIYNSETVDYRTVVIVYGYEDYYNSEDTVLHLQTREYANEALPDGFEVFAELDDDCNLIIRAADNTDGSLNYWVEAACKPAIKNEYDNFVSGSKLVFYNDETGNSCWLQNIAHENWDDTYFELRTFDNSVEKYLYVSRKVLTRFLINNGLSTSAGSKYYFGFETYGYQNYYSNPETEGQYIVLPENLTKEAPQLIITETDEGDVIISSEDPTDVNFIGYIEDLYYGKDNSDSFISFISPGRDYGNAFWSISQDFGESIYINELNQLVITNAAIIQVDIMNGLNEVQIFVSGYEPDTIIMEVLLQHAKKQAPDVNIEVDTNGNLIISCDDPDWFNAINDILFTRMLEDDQIEYYDRPKDVLHISGNEAVIYKDDLMGLLDGNYYIEFHADDYGTITKNLTLSGYTIERTAEVKVTCSKGDLIITCNDKKYMEALAAESKWYHGDHEERHTEGGSIMVLIGDDCSPGYTNSREYFNGEETYHYTSYTLASTKTKITMKKQQLIKMHVYNTNEATIVLRAPGYEDVALPVSLNNLCNPNIPDDLLVTVEENGDVVISSSDNNWLKALYAITDYDKGTDGGSLSFVPIDNPWAEYVVHNNKGGGITLIQAEYSSGRITIKYDDLGLKSGDYTLYLRPYMYRETSYPVTLVKGVKNAPAPGTVTAALDADGNLIITSEGNEDYLRGIVSWQMVNKDGLITKMLVSYIQIYEENGNFMETLYNNDNQYENVFFEKVRYDEENQQVVVPREYLSQFSGNNRHVFIKSYDYDPYDAGTMDFPFITVSSADMLAGDTLQFVVNTEQNVIWSVDDENLATVDAEGNLTAKKSGTVYLSAQIEGNEYVDTIPVTITNYMVEEINLSAPSVEVAAGKSITLVAEVLPATAKNKALVWTSSDTGIATVSSGKVTAKKVTEISHVTITATAKDGSGIQGSIELTVVPAVSSIAIEYNGVDYAGKTLPVDPEDTPELQLYAFTAPADASDVVTWTSSSTKLATVDENGKVTIVGAKGKVKITAKAADGSGKSAAVTLNIAKLVDGVVISGPTEVAIGKSIKLTAEVFPEDAASKALVWYSSNSNVAVSGGKVTVKKTAKAGETAVIEAYAKDTMDISGDYVITVKEATTKVNIFKEGGIDVTGSILGVDPEDTLELQLSASTEPIEASKAVTWTSSSAKLATVDENGKVTLTGAKGKVKITAKAADGSGKSAVVTLNIAKLVKRIEIDGPTEVVAGKAIKLTAEVFPEEADSKALIWTSSDTSIATVSSGKVTAKKVTEASNVTITATAKDGSGVARSYEVLVRPLTSLIIIRDKDISELPANATIETAQDEGKTYQLYYSVFPNGADWKVDWTTSNSAIATVDVTGLVTFTGVKGSVKITVTTKDGSKKSASVTFVHKEESNSVRKIGAAIYNFDDNFMISYMQYINDYIEELNSTDPDHTYEVEFVNGQADAEIQTAQIEDFIAQDYDGMIVQPVDASTTDLADMIQDSGIPTVFINRMYQDYEYSGNMCYVGVDARGAGSAQGQIVYDLPAHGDLNSDGTVQYVMIMGDAQNGDAQYRTEESVAYLTDRGVQANCLYQEEGYWAQSLAKTLVEDALNSYGSEIEVIFCNNDGMALGAIEAVEEAGLTVGTDIYVVGIDGLTEAYAAISEGRLTGTVINDSHCQAVAACDSVITLMNGGTIQNRINYIPYVIVTAENVDDYYGG